MIQSKWLSEIPGLLHGFGTRMDQRPRGVITVQQVHGKEILEVSEAPQSEPEGFDVLMTDRLGVAVAVKTADCLPILMVEPKAKLVVAIHAGWKGTLLRVAQEAVKRIVERGGQADAIVCALGPNMTETCFEVESDVVHDFEKAFPGWPILKPVSKTKWLLDVALTNRLQLQEMGITDDRIDRIDLCTHCRPDLFHSYRRDKDKAGRMISFIQRV